MSDQTITSLEDGHCDICGQPIKGPELCANDIDLGPCHAACLEGSPIVSFETGEVLPEAKPHIYRWDDLPVDQSGEATHV